MDAFNSCHFAVGTLDCIAIYDGADISPVEHLAKNIPPEQVRQALLERGYSPTEVTLGFNCLLIRAGQRRILVDAGWGLNPGQPRQQAVVFGAHFPYPGVGRVTPHQGVWHWHPAGEVEAS